MYGDFFINGKDAFAEYGLVLGSGSVASILCPGPAKSYIVNDVRGEDGKRYSANLTYLDERSFTITVYIKACCHQDLYNKLAKLSEDAFEDGMFTIKTRYNSATYHVLYKGCQQLTEFNGRLARFSIQLVEPDPSNRTA